LKEKHDKKGDDDAEDVVAKLTGSTLDTLQRCLVRDSLASVVADQFSLTIYSQHKPTELVLKGADGAVSKVTVSLKYIPVQMDLDPSESINNMGNLRVDVLDADDLPSADRNGFSDPYCKFELNGKEVYKTKVQKKTLHPAWNEYFECPISSRAAANFRVRVMDWDFGEKADLLGEAAINLEILDTFKPQEVILKLDGKSGALRLKMLFKPDYVRRSRQGSSTFSGTFATPGKVIGAPVKGVGMVGGGVVKGASFLRHGFKSKKENRDLPSGTMAEEEPESMADGAPLGMPDNPGPMFERSPSAMPLTPPHGRTRSIGGVSTASAAGNTPTKSAPGTASFSILSASGYSPSAKVQVHVRQTAPKKDFHKTKGLKSPSGTVQWEQETFKVNCAPDTQFQLVVKDDKMFGDETLGEALFFIDDSSTGSEKTVNVGSGTVTVKTTFTPAEESFKERSLKDSPRAAQRKSFLGRRNVTPS